MAAGFGFAFFFVTTSTSVAQGQERCQVCHKQRQTITIACEAVDRHIAHGDTAGPCPASPTRGPRGNKNDSTTAESSTFSPAFNSVVAGVQRAVD